MGVIMNIQQILYILDLDWKSCIILTNVSGLGGTALDIVDKDAISYEKDMIVCKKEDAVTYLSIDSIIGFKLFDKTFEESFDFLRLKPEEFGFGRVAR